ncbi:MAG: hypothetical protein ACNS60_03925 [Candidatus Cyclobacteriaceae bacterium M2_1C_046]
MKRLAITIILLGVVFSTSAQSKKECKAFKDGYYYIGDTYPGSFIKREGNRQMEILEFGTILLFNVDWTDDCTYKLSLDSIINPELHPLKPEWNKDEFIHVSITKSTRDGYQKLSSTNFVDQNIFSTVVRTDEESFMERLKEVNNGDMRLAEDL